jgi:hypothetical protein
MNICNKCKKEKDIVYANTEMGYLTNTYGSMKKKHRKVHTLVSLRISYQK